MKRVLFISHHLNRAGTETFMMNVFRGIDHSRFMVDFLIYTKKDTDYTREVEKAGCKIWRVPSRRESFFGWYSSLNRFFKEHAKEYAAVHYCGNGLTAIAPLLFAYKYGIPVRIAHSHSSSSDGWHNRFLHRLQRGFAQRITTHHFACSSLAAKWFYGDAPAVVINNGIDSKKFSYNIDERNEMRKKLGISDSTVVLGHVGRFEKEKNHEFLLDVFARFLLKNSDSYLILIGVGSLFEEVKEKADKLGVIDKVMFMGERSDVNVLLQAMDIFVMPSIFEGQPFVLIEAQCAGLPCLVSDVVNKDICLTDNVKTVSLLLSADEWALKVEQLLSTFIRKDQSEIVEKQGYSIASTIKYLENVYEGNI